MLLSLLLLALPAEPEMLVHTPGRPCVETAAELLKGRVVVAPLIPAMLPPQTGDFEALRQWARLERAMHKHAALLVVDGSDRGMRWHLYYGEGQEALRVIGPSHGCQLTRRAEVQARRWLVDHLVEGTVGMPPPIPRSAPPPPSAPSFSETSSAAAEASGSDDDASWGRDPEPSPSAPQPTRARPAVFEIAAGVDLVSHTFRYLEPATPNTRELRFDLVPIPRLGARLRPFSGVMGPLTLSADLRQSLGLDAAPVEGGAHVSLSFFELGLSLGWELEVTASDRQITIAPAIGFHQVATSVGAGPMGADVPSVVVSSGSAGAGIRVPVKGRISVAGSAAYLLTVATGGNLSSAAFFPSPTIHGLDLAAALQVELGAGFEGRFMVGYLQYFMSFSPKAGATRVAGGARDETINVSAVLCYRPR